MADAGNIAASESSSPNPSTYEVKLYNLQLAYFLDTKKSYLQGFTRHQQNVCDTDLDIFGTFLNKKLE